MGFISDFIKGRGLSKGDDGVSDKIRLGKAGEARAVAYLKKKKYKILERNYRSRSGEIDIIALHKDTLVFIEVKTRSSDEFGSAVEAVDIRKRRHIVKVAEGYLKERGLDDDIYISFDVIGIEFKDADATIEHIEGAFSSDDI